MNRFTRIAVGFAGAILWGAGLQRPAPMIIAFYHENVMGTSLELRVRAADEAAARRAEDLVLRRIDRLSTIFSGYDPSSEFSRWQSGAERPATSLGRALRGLAGIRILAVADRRGVRSSRRGALPAVGRLCPAGPIAVLRRNWSSREGD